MAIRLLTNILLSQISISSLALAFLGAEPEPGIQMHVAHGGRAPRRRGIREG